MFSGYLYGGVYGQSSKRVIVVYKTRLKSIDIIPLQSDVVDMVSMCGQADYTNPEFFIAATISPSPNAREASLLWRRASWDSKRDQVIEKTEGLVRFPRVSHDSKWLSWLENAGNEEHLLLYNLRSGSRHVAALNMTDDKCDLSAPGLGCPYSWSPLGDQIAYADGSKIKFVRVDQ
jgi:hypothetical protein